MPRKSLKKKTKTKKKKISKTGKGGWSNDYLKAQRKLKTSYDEEKNFKDPSEWDDYYARKNNDQNDDFLETEPYNPRETNKEKLREHNYLLIIGILIAACIGLYNGIVLDAWNIFWIIYVGIAIYGSIATFLKKW